MRHESTITLSEIESLDPNTRFFKNGDARICAVRKAEHTICIEFMTYQKGTFDTIEVKYYLPYLKDKLKNFERCDKNEFISELKTVLGRSNELYNNSWIDGAEHYMENLDLIGTYSCYDYKLHIETFKDKTIKVVLVDRGHGNTHKVHHFTFKGMSGDGKLIPYKTQ